MASQPKAPGLTFSRPLTSHIPFHHAQIFRSLLADFLKGNKNKRGIRNHGRNVVGLAQSKLRHRMYLYIVSLCLHP